ncbi:MAG: restriction endonuclease, SacI family [Acidobacteria bacterium]|nr:restriction endonuclease, SacI family [Acidobacteriota bacterium]
MSAPNNVLERIYQRAQQDLQNEQIRFPAEIENNVAVLIAHLQKNKSVVAALVTSLLKKILNPEQDVRLHRTDFDGGYSARGLDTNVTTPFFKRHFPTYANKESSFLTLATRERIKWTKSDGENLKIRNSAFRTAFLDALDDVETGRQQPEEYLRCLFQRLLHLSADALKIFEQTASATATGHALNINLILTMLRDHFAGRHSSRLPVVAIYTIYQLLTQSLNRYQDKILQPLKVHTSSDRKGYGDIEIFDAEGQPFEIVEVKHNIALDRYLIFDVARKAQRTRIKRYYILTTFERNFANAEEEQAVNELILRIKRGTGLEIIPNGITQTLKYYLRFVEDYEGFLQGYAQNLIAEAQISTEVTTAHLEKWNEIVKRHLVEDEIESQM